MSTSPLNDHHATDDTPPGQVFASQWDPHPALQPFVTSISGYREQDGLGSFHNQPPTVDTVPMILVLDKGWDYQTSDSAHDLGQSFIAGVRSTPVLMISQGYASCVQINFSPLGARRFLGIDMNELSESIEPLENALGSLSRRLEDKLHSLSSWEDRFRFLESFLLDRLLTSDTQRSLHSRAVEHAMKLMGDTNTPSSVSDIAHEIGISRKHLVSLFTREVGVSPSRYQQISQLGTALDLMRSSHSRNLKLIDVAFDSGYADQPHFSRQFRRYMNCSPNEFMKSLSESAVA